MRPLSSRRWLFLLTLSALFLFSFSLLHQINDLSFTRAPTLVLPSGIRHLETAPDSKMDSKPNLAAPSSSSFAGFLIGPQGVRSFVLSASAPLAHTRPTVLVTGGAGYIGSHTCVELLEAGFAVVVVDSLVNAKPESLLRVQEITGKELYFYPTDLRDEKKLDLIFTAHAPIDSVIHFAGLKAVGESVALPVLYYENNLISSLALLKTMKQHQVKKLVFSSSATVYGDPKELPITEKAELHATNPYGRTKLFIEQIIADYAAATPGSMSVLLRYFNPVGAHPSGKIGEDPNGTPNNLVPYISQVAVGKLPKLRVYGSDWPTPDGTGVRDYIHVVDLAKGHIAALQKLIADQKKQTEDEQQEKGQLYVYNLGTGKGYSVLQMVEAMREASGKSIEVEFTERRPGDIASCFADPTKAREELGWRAQLELKRMMEDTWRWQSANPQGFPSTNDHLIKI